MHTCPDGFEANDDRCAPYTQIPDKKGHLVTPKLVRYLDDGHIAAYAMGALIDTMPYVVDIFAEPSLDNEDEPFKPMPHWYRAILHADESHWQILYKETYKFTSWGITADLKRHRDLTKVIDRLVSKIEFMQRDLEGARQAAEMCEYRLQAAWAHKYAKHAQGLINASICISKQNVQAFHIICKGKQGDGHHNNNNKNNKGKGRAF